MDGTTVETISEKIKVNISHHHFWKYFIIRKRNIATEW